MNKRRCLAVLLPLCLSTPAWSQVQMRLGVGLTRITADPPATPAFEGLDPVLHAPSLYAEVASPTWGRGLVGLRGTAGMAWTVSREVMEGRVYRVPEGNAYAMEKVVLKEGGPRAWLGFETVSGRKVEFGLLVRVMSGSHEVQYLGGKGGQALLGHGIGFHVASRPEPGHWGFGGRILRQRWGSKDTYLITDPVLPVTTEASVFLSRFF